MCIIHSMRANDRKKRAFTDEFNIDAVFLVQRPNMSLAKLARDLDLTPPALAKWVKKFGTLSDSEKAIKPESSFEQLKQQCLDQQKQIRLLKMECDILKQLPPTLQKP